MFGSGGKFGDTSGDVNSYWSSTVAVPLVPRMSMLNSPPGARWLGGTAHRLLPSNRVIDEGDESVIICGCSVRSPGGWSL